MHAVYMSGQLDSLLQNVNLTAVVDCLSPIFCIDVFTQMFQNLYTKRSKTTCMMERAFLSFQFSIPTISCYFCPSNFPTVQVGSKTTDLLLPEKILLFTPFR